MGLWSYLDSDGSPLGICCNGRDNLQSKRTEIKSRKRKTSANVLNQKSVASSQVTPPSTNQDISVNTVNSTSGSSRAHAPPTPTATTTITKKAIHPPSAQIPQPIHSDAAKTSLKPSEYKVVEAIKEYEPPQPPAKETTPEPPKIDFVETGSIFGDRKRTGTDHNMFLLENGKFKSPGKSKIIPGPGGRSIRMTFQRGFPAHKSIESRSSLPSISATPSAQKNSVESVKTKSSVDGSQERFELMSKKIKSDKFTQSNQSMEGVDSDPPGSRSPNDTD